MNPLKTVRDAISRVTDNATMVEAPKRSRRIEVVQALFVTMLADLGKLPAVPRLPDTSAFGYRKPGLAEGMALTWAVEWSELGALDAHGFRDVAGIIGFRDGYDFHSASDVREIVYLNGSRRAIVDLFGWIRREAAASERRVIGSFDCDNTSLLDFVTLLGGKQTRVFFEDAMAGGKGGVLSPA